MSGVGIIMGSYSDLPQVDPAISALRDFSVPFEVRIASAHRTPDLVKKWAETAEARELRVLIAAAGGAAHLAGVVAGHTTLPVIGVPIGGTSLLGLDSLLSVVQMPTGIPVATVAIGGAENAALLAIQILALSDPDLTEKLRAHRKKMRGQVIAKDKKLQDKLQNNE